MSYISLILEFMYKTVRIFGALMLAAMICLTGYDVFSRYTFNSPVLGTNEMTQFILGGMVFAGFAMVAAHRSHIVVSLFENVLTRHVPYLYHGLVVGFNLIGIITITYVAFLYTEFQLLMQGETEILGLQWGKLGLVLTVLSAIGILFAIKSLKTPRRHGSYVPFKAAVVAQKSPCSVELVGGEKYAWCACGLSAKQPFCDGAHKATDMKPLIFTAPISGLSDLCGCKMSANAPYCNGAHNDI